MRRSTFRYAVLVMGTAVLACAQGVPDARAQSDDALRLEEAVRPPTRVIPGDEIVMTVFDPALFPVGGRWTIGERPISPQPGSAGGDYTLAFQLPADFPSAWDRLPIFYSDERGQVRYDSRGDERSVVRLADIADLTPLAERTGRVTGASTRASPAGRFCVCGFFPERRSWKGLSLAGNPLGEPVTASATELWFDVPDDLPPGVQEIAADPEAGFPEGARTTIEIVGADPSAETDACPCANGNAFLSEWAESGIRRPEGATERPGVEPARPDGEPASAEPVIWLESLGGSTGEVLRAHVVGPGGGPVQLEGLFAVEPVSLSPAESERILESVRRSPGSHLDVQANFYCLQFGAAAPPEGVVYRIAPQTKQERFQPAARALAAARTLLEAGSLSPDTNPDSYFHSIRQWSVWTLEQGFDREGFTEAFVDLARRNVQDAGQEWSAEFEERVRGSAEGRWQDVTKVLKEAGLRGEEDSR